MQSYNAIQDLASAVEEARAAAAVALADALAESDRQSDRKLRAQKLEFETSIKYLHEEHRRAIEEAVRVERQRGDKLVADAVAEQLAKEYTGMRFW